MAKLRTQSYADIEIDRLNKEIARLRAALSDAEYTSTVWESKCKDLRAALDAIQQSLEFIMESSVLNGEDVSFLLAKQALGDRDE